MDIQQERRQYLIDIAADLALGIPLRCGIPPEEIDEAKRIAEEIGVLVPAEHAGA